MYKLLRVIYHYYITYEKISEIPEQFSNILYSVYINTTSNSLTFFIDHSDYSNSDKEAVYLILHSAIQECKNQFNNPTALSKLGELLYSSLLTFIVNYDSKLISLLVSFCDFTEQCIFSEYSV